MKSIYALSLSLLLALPAVAHADGLLSSLTGLLDGGSKYSSDSKTGDSSSSTTDSSTIQSNCTAIDSSGMRVAGVWVPSNNVTLSAAQSSSVPDVQGVKRYRDINAQ